MANNPITIGIDAETKGAEAGLDRVADALGSVDDTLSDVQDAGRQASDGLDDVAQAGTDAGRDAARGLDKVADGAKDAADAADKLDRDLTAALSDAGDKADQAGRSIGDNIKDGTSRASEGLDEMKDESAQTAREAAASFSGDPLDALDMLQEAAANALVGFGPAGAAAGIAAAIGLGIAQAKLQEIADQANEAAEAAGELALKWRDATHPERLEDLRTRWDELATSIADNKSWWEVWQDEAVTTIEQIAAAADDAGPAVAEFVAAFNTTDPIERQAQLGRLMADTRRRADDLRRASAEMTAQQQLANESFATGSLAIPALTDAQLDHLKSMQDEIAALDDLLPLIEEQHAEQEKSNRITRALAEAQGLTVQAYEEQQAAAARAAEAQESYNDALASAADAVTVYDAVMDTAEQAARDAAQAQADATEDTKDTWEDYVQAATVTTQSLIDEWNRQADEAAAFEGNLATIAAAGGQALADELRAKGPEVAGAVASVIATSDPAQQRAAIDAHARATGAEMSGATAAGIRSGQAAVQGAADDVARGITPPTITFDTQVTGLEAVRRQLNDIANQTFRPSISPMIARPGWVGGSNLGG